MRLPLGAASGWNLLVVGVAGLGLAISSYANIDGDVYWHRVLGQHWLDNLSFDLTPDPIAYTPAEHEWFPTAWLPEVLYALLVAGFGYDGVLALRFVLALLFFVLLIRFLATRAPAWVAALALCIVGLPGALVLQDRPQTISLVICAALLPSIDRWWREGRVPPLRNAVVLTWLWANLHGLWILVPAFLLVCAAGRLISRDADGSRAPAVGALLCLGVAAVTPVGLRLLLAPLRIRSSSSQLSEWGATSVASPVAWGFLLGLLVLLVCVSLGGKPLAPRQVVLLVPVAIFGFLAYRNAVFASIVLLPAVVDLTSGPLSRVRTSVMMPKAVLAGAAVAVLIGVGNLYAGQSVVPDTAPSRIAERLSSYSAVQVLAPYNDSGYLREFGGAGVRLAIDGRADRYGDQRIRDHLALMDARGPWRRQFATLDPDLVVVDRGSALRDELLRDGWTVEVRDRRLVLLRPS